MMIETREIETGPDLVFDCSVGRDVGAHVMRATETAHWLEWQDWANPVLQEPYPVSDGKIHIPDRPGLGLDWDEDAISAYSAD